MASGKFGSGQTWVGAKVAGQTWSGQIWFGQTWDVIVHDPANVKEKRTSQNNLQYKIPKKVFEEFKKRANLKKVQTLAFLVGFKIDDIITVTHIVFGKQNAFKHKVYDDGK